MREERPPYGNVRPSEKTFEHLVKQQFPTLEFNDRHDYEMQRFSAFDMIELMRQVREATIAEAVEFCVSQDWVKTIDNLKRLPKDRIHEFEKPKE